MEHGCYCYLHQQILLRLFSCFLVSMYFTLGHRELDKLIHD